MGILVSPDHPRRVGVLLHRAIHPQPFSHQPGPQTREPNAPLISTTAPTRPRIAIVKPAPETDPRAVSDPDLQGQHQSERGINMAELAERQVAGGGAQAGRVDGCRLLGEDTL